MRKERADASGTWQRQALHAHSPAAGCWRCVPGPCGADGTSQEPQSTHSLRGLAHPDCPPREPLEGPRTLQGLRHSLWVQSGVNCGGPAGPGSSRQQGGWLAVHDPRAAGEQTCPCRLASPRSAGAKDVPPGVQACPRMPGTLLGAASPLGIRRTDAIGTRGTDSKLPSRKVPEEPGRPTRLILLGRGPVNTKYCPASGSGSHRGPDGDGRSPRLSANSVLLVALKQIRKVTLKDPLTGLLSGGPVAKRAALGPQRSQEADFPKRNSWSDVPALLFSSITFS